MNTRHITLIQKEISTKGLRLVLNLREASCRERGFFRHHWGFDERFERELVAAGGGGLAAKAAAAVRAMSWVEVA